MKRFVPLLVIALPAPASAEEVLDTGALSISLEASPRAEELASGVRVAGSWRLSSSDKQFGGVSAMMMRNNALTLLTDSGRLFDLEDGHPVRSRALPAACARPLGRKKADAEAMTLAPDGQGIRVSLERVNMVCAWSPDRPETATLSAVAGMSQWKRNRGAEAMASLAGQGTLIIGEGAQDDAGLRPLLWFHGDPADAATPVTTMRYQPPAGFKPGDAAFLPDGRLIVLNRQTKFGKQAASILTIHPALTPETDAVLPGRVLARIAHSALAANYEGMALEPRAGGATIWLVSDDNFRGKDGTRLLRLDMAE
ncbi:MAG: esterase-like activity of phytase family protein [Sphingomonadales bacterium]|nr:esterase-like activity of phytase family protein [Sphingomonadales bacterium]